MFQLYVFIDGSKWTEEYATFAECADRVSALAPDLYAAVSARVEIIKPDGCRCHEVTK